MPRLPLHEKTITSPIAQILILAWYATRAPTKDVLGALTESAFRAVPFLY